MVPSVGRATDLLLCPDTIAGDTGDLLALLLLVLLRSLQ